MHIRKIAWLKSHLFHMGVPFEETEDTMTLVDSRGERVSYDKDKMYDVRATRDWVSIATGNGRKFFRRRR